MDWVKTGQVASELRFSVVIPAYNAAAYLHETLASIAAAQAINRLDEIIVVDDASTDNTSAIAWEALQACSLPGRVLRNVANQGVGLTRQRGFSVVSSPLIACVDADDICWPGRFLESLTLLDRFPTLQLVGGDLQLFDDPVRPLQGDPLRRLAGQRVSLPMRGEDIAAALVFYCPLYAGVSTFRRSLLQQVMVPGCSVGEDWLFVHRVVQAFGPQAVANTGTILASYRRHKGQLTCNAFVDNRDVLAVWREILQATLEIEADQESLALHARYSPPQHPPVSVLEQYRWQSWCCRLRQAAKATEYVPRAMARLLQGFSQRQSLEVTLSCPLD